MARVFVTKKHFFVSYIMTWEIFNTNLINCTNTKYVVHITYLHCILDYQKLVYICDLLRSVYASFIPAWNMLRCLYILLILHVYTGKYFYVKIMWIELYTKVTWNSLNINFMWKTNHTKFTWRLKFHEFHLNYRKFYSRNS